MNTETITHDTQQTTALELVQQTLTLPSATWSERGLSIDDAITDDCLLALGSRLGAVDGVMSWAWADYLLALYRRFCDADNGPSGDKHGHDSWLQDYCETHGIDGKRRKEALAMALFYHPEHRTIPLGYEYYREALFAPGIASTTGREKALGWIKTARGQDMTLAKFRKLIRGECRETEGEQTAHADIRAYADLLAANRYARQQLFELRKGAFTAERALAILSDLADLRAFISALEKYADETPQS